MPRRMWISSWVTCGPVEQAGSAAASAFWVRAGSRKPMCDQETPAKCASTTRSPVAASAMRCRFSGSALGQGWYRAGFGKAAQCQAAIHTQSPCKRRADVERAEFRVARNTRGRHGTGRRRHWRMPKPLGAEQESHARLRRPRRYVRCGIRITIGSLTYATKSATGPRGICASSLLSFQ